MKHKIIEEIKKEFFLINHLQSMAQFQCFGDHIATYEVKENNGTSHEICIINEDVTFFREEKVCDLLDLNRTSFLSHSVFIRKDNGDMEQIGEGRYYRISDEEDYQDPYKN